MTGRRDDIREADLLAYADGRLDADPPRKARVEDYLRSRPGLRATLAQDSRIIALIRDHYRAPAGPPPPAMLEALRKAPRGGRRLAFPVAIAGAGAAAAALLLAVIVLEGATPPSQSAPAEIASVADVAFILERRGQSVFPDLTPWRLQRVEVSPGGGGGVRLRAIYEQDGQALTLAIGPAGGGQVASLDDLRWTSGALSYALSGDLPEAELRQVAARARQDREALPPADAPGFPIVEPPDGPVIAVADAPAVPGGAPPVIGSVPVESP